MLDVMMPILWVDLRPDFGVVYKTNYTECLFPAHWMSAFYLTRIREALVYYNHQLELCTEDVDINSIRNNVVGLYSSVTFAAMEMMIKITTMQRRYEDWFVTRLVRISRKASESFEVFLTRGAVDILTGLLNAKKEFTMKSVIAYVSETEKIKSDVSFPVPPFAAPLSTRQCLQQLSPKHRRVFETPSAGLLLEERLLPGLKGRGAFDDMITFANTNGVNKLPQLPGEFQAPLGNYYSTVMDHLKRIRVHLTNLAGVYYHCNAPTIPDYKFTGSDVLTIAKLADAIRRMEVIVNDTKVWNDTELWTSLGESAITPVINITNIISSLYYIVCTYVINLATSKIIRVWLDTHVKPLEAQLVTFRNEFEMHINYRKSAYSDMIAYKIRMETENATIASLDETKQAGAMITLRGKLALERIGGSIRTLLDNFAVSGLAITAIKVILDVNQIDMHVLETAGLYLMIHEVVTFLRSLCSHQRCYRPLAVLSGFADYVDGISDELQSFATNNLPLRCVVTLFSIAGTSHIISVILKFTADHIIKAAVLSYITNTSLLAPVGLVVSTCISGIGVLWRKQSELIYVGTYFLFLFTFSGVSSYISDATSDIPTDALEAVYTIWSGDNSWYGPLVLFSIVRLFMVKCAAMALMLLYLPMTIVHTVTSLLTFNMIAYNFPDNLQLATALSHWITPGLGCIMYYTKWPYWQRVFLAIAILCSATHITQNFESILTPLNKYVLTPYPHPVVTNVNFDEVRTSYLPSRYEDLVWACNNSIANVNLSLQFLPLDLRQFALSTGGLVHVLNGTIDSHTLVQWRTQTEHFEHRIISRPQSKQDLIGWVKWVYSTTNILAGIIDINRTLHVPTGDAANSIAANFIYILRLLKVHDSSLQLSKDQIKKIISQIHYRNDDRGTHDGHMNALKNLNSVTNGTPRTNEQLVQLLNKLFQYYLPQSRQFNRAQFSKAMAAMANCYTNSKKAAA